MKTKSIPLLLIPVIALASCQTTQTASIGTDHEELASAYAAPEVRFSKVRVTCKIVSEDTTKALPPIVIRRGHSKSSSVSTEGIYPTDFEFPKVVKVGEQNAFPVTPANPTAFDVDNFGWKMDLRADARESFIMLRGTLTEHRMGDKIRSGGVPFQPITTKASDALGRDVEVILTDNRAERPTKVTEEFPIFIASQPGETSRVYLDEKRTTYAEFTCQIID